MKAYQTLQSVCACVRRSEKLSCWKTGNLFCAMKIDSQTENEHREVVRSFLTSSQVKSRVLNFQVMLCLHAVFLTKRVFSLCFLLIKAAVGDIFILK